MSNPNEYKLLQEKIIQLKPVKIRENKQAIENLESATVYVKDIEKEIEGLTDKLTRLEEEYQERKEELENEIEKKRLSWEREKEAYIEEAEKIGFQSGYNQGKEESLKKYEGKIEEINKLTRMARKDYQATVESSSEIILQLAIETAKRILHEELTQEPTSFNQIVKGVLKTVNTDETISIYVHASKYELIVKHKDQLKRSVDGQTSIQVFIDNDLDENSLIIEHPFGKIDASIDTQLKEIHKLLENINNGE